MALKKNSVAIILMLNLNLTGLIPANELDLLLSKIFISVRKQNGTEYEPGTLSGFQFFDTNKKVSNHSVKDQCSTTSRSRRSAKLRCTAKRSQKFEKPRQLPFSISEATARNVCYPESWARYRKLTVLFKNKASNHEAQKHTTRIEFHQSQITNDDL